MPKGKRIKQILIIVGVVLLSLTTAGCTLGLFGKRHTKAQNLKKQSEISEEECKAIILTHLKEKYDEDFTIEYLGPLSFYCQYNGKARLVSEEPPYRFDFWAAIYKDGTLTCEDTYFQFVIKDDYEKYMSDIVAEVFPVNDARTRYSTSLFKGFDKDSTLEDLLKEYENRRLLIRVSVYIKESEVKDKEKDMERLASILLSKKFYDTLSINVISDDYYDAVIDKEPVKASHILWDAFIATSNVDGNDDYEILYNTYTEEE